MVFPVVVLVFDFNESSEGVLHGHYHKYLENCIDWRLDTCMEGQIIPLSDYESDL
jgi:hypothetical protein